MLGHDMISYSQVQLCCSKHELSQLRSRAPRSSVVSKWYIDLYSAWDVPYCYRIHPVRKTRSSSGYNSSHRCIRQSGPWWPSHNDRFQSHANHWAKILFSYTVRYGIPELYLLRLHGRLWWWQCQYSDVDIVILVYINLECNYSGKPPLFKLI